MQQQQEAYSQPLPGQRFCPMEDELLYFFLKPMIESGSQSVHGLNNVVFDCDLYGDQEPWEIWDTYKNVRPHDLRLNKDLYFLTKLKKRITRTKNSQRISRTVGRNGGTWKGNDYGKPVKILGTGVKIGCKKRFTYENKDSEHDGCWIMHEFSLDPSARDKKKAKTENDEYVLCLLRRNVEAKAKRGQKNERRIRQREEVEEEEGVDVVDNNKNDACNDGEESNRKQEELHEPQTKRQRNVRYEGLPEIVLPMMPSSEANEDDDDMYIYVDELLGSTLEGDQDQGEVGVQQQLGHDVTQQACPPLGSEFEGDHNNGFDEKLLEESRQTMIMQNQAHEMMNPSLQQQLNYDVNNNVQQVVEMTRPCSDVDEFAAELEGLLEGDQDDDDDSSPPYSEDESAMIGFQDHAGDVGLQQQLRHEVQPPCPPLVLEGDHHINGAIGFQDGAVDDAKMMMMQQQEVEKNQSFQELLNMVNNDEIDYDN